MSKTELVGKLEKHTTTRSAKRHHNEWMEQVGNEHEAKQDEAYRVCHVADVKEQTHHGKQRQMQDLGESHTPSSFSLTKELRTHTATGQKVRPAEAAVLKPLEIVFRPCSRSLNKRTMESLRSTLRTKAQKNFRFTVSEKNNTLPSSLDYETGFVYAYYREPHMDYIKIGKTKENVEDYLRKMERDCKVKPETFVLIHKSEPIKHPLKVESLVHEELISTKHSLHFCQCLRDVHREWFKVDKETAVKAIERWSGWMASGEHYTGAKTEYQPDKTSKSTSESTPKWTTTWTFSASAEVALDNVLKTLKGVPRGVYSYEDNASYENTEPSSNVLLHTPKPSSTPLSRHTTRNNHATTINDSDSDSDTPFSNPRQRTQTQKKAPVRPGPTALPTPPDSHSRICTTDLELRNGPPPPCALPTEASITNIATAESDPFLTAATTTTTMTAMVTPNSTLKGTGVYIRVPVPAIAINVWSWLSPLSNRFWSRSPSPAEDTLVVG